MNQLTSKEARLWTLWPLRLEADAYSLMQQGQARSKRMNLPDSFPTSIAFCSR